MAVLPHVFALLAGGTQPAAYFDDNFNAVRNVTPSAQTTTYTTVVGDHLKPIHVTGNTQINLGDASTMVAGALGYETVIINVGTGVVTVALGNATNALNGIANGTLVLPPRSSVCLGVNGTSDGYEVLWASKPYRQAANVASASTLNLDAAADGDYVHVTGVATITAITLQKGEEKTVVFDGALTLTNGASLILPTGANIGTAAGDTAIFRGEASGVVRCTMYQTVTTTAFTTGDVKLTLKTVADTGWVLMNDGTIGDASSGGTTRANADTSPLFTLLWNNTADADCAVSGGRGASAAADFAAHKTIALPKALGRALACYGSGSGLTARALAHILGEETHTLTAGETGTPVHNHTATTSSSFVVSSSGAASSTGLAGNSNTDAFQPNLGGIASAGSQTVTSSTTVNNATGASGSPHNNMQPTVFLNVMVKL